MMGRPLTGRRHLWVSEVSGIIRVPAPAATIIASIRVFSPVYGEALRWSFPRGYCSCGRAGSHCVSTVAIRNLSSSSIGMGDNSDLFAAAAPWYELLAAFEIYSAPIFPLEPKLYTHLDRASMIRSFLAVESYSNISIRSGTSRRHSGETRSPMSERT